MDYEKYNILFQRLFDLAFNLDYQKPQSGYNIQAIKLAANIIKNYNLNEPASKIAVRAIHFKITNSRKNYVCDNSSEHKILYGHYYVNILQENAFRPIARSCLSCAAKMVLPIIANFPPLSLVLYENSDIDWSLID
jgi:hypothetical protein